MKNLYEPRLLQQLKMIRVHTTGRFNVEDCPVAVVDGTAYRIKELSSPLAGRSAYLVGINQSHVSKVCDLIRAEIMMFNDMRVYDLKPFTSLSHLRHLGIERNTKLEDITPLVSLTSLRSLVLVNTPKVRDLSPLLSLLNLEAIEFSGGMWNKKTALSLGPFSSLKNLTELMMINTKVEFGGIRPLGECKALRYLAISNFFPTEDFAFLAAHLRNTACDLFVPWVRLQQPVGDKDVMVVGARKRFLNSRMDRKLMDKYANEWLKLVQQYLPTPR